MKIYFAASIRGGWDDQHLYQELIEFLNQDNSVLTEHIGNPNLTSDGQKPLSDHEIRTRDINWLKESDVVVAETTHPSLGVGYELVYAERINKPVIILHRKTETKLSAMINGTDYFKNINYYSSLAEAERILKTRLNELN